MTEGKESIAMLPEYDFRNMAGGKRGKYYKAYGEAHTLKAHLPLFSKEEAFNLIIYEIIWKQQFVEKLATKHRVSIEEAEAVLGSNPVMRKVGKGHVKGENVYAAYAQIRGGRYLIVFFINKKGNRALPISARDMDHVERRYYEKQRK